MFLHQLELSPEVRARDIVELDHRTADVFKQYGIPYCCGGQFPLGQICDANHIDINSLFTDLQKACYQQVVPARTDYSKWPVDFMIDYIVNIYHRHLFAALPELDRSIADFIKKHGDKYPHFSELYQRFRLLTLSLPQHMQQEEENIFPYLRQVAHAYQEDESHSFARLLIKTLGKPLTSQVEEEHRMLSDSLILFRRLTKNYSAPQGACASHKVLLGKLRDLDNHLAQHHHLENEILIPRVIAMEKELLERNQ